MNIFLIGSASSIHISKWANGLAEAGNDVTLVSLHEVTQKFRKDVSIVRFRRWLGFGYIFASFRVRRLRKRIAPDVVNAHYATGYGTLGVLSGTRGLLVSVWGADVYDFPLRSSFHRRWLQWVLTSAQSVASTSEAMSDHVKAIFPELPRPVVTPFGVDTDLFKVGDERQKGKFVVGTVKTLEPKYGIDVLIRAFERLCRFIESGENPDLKHIYLELRIVGEGSEFYRLNRLVEDLGIARKVVFVGRVDNAEVPNELAHMDVYCALSVLDSESFGVAVVEASSCGLPVVVSDVGGLPEVCLDGKTGYVVERRNDVLAYEKLRTLLETPSLCSTMGRAGADYVRENYSWSSCVKSMESTLAACSVSDVSSDQ